ncbi:nuclear transport factor 2 family protein [Sphaerisporangium fuscum]|uniref:nuclear transport factor 2 family protein n=1 Tax=Sphaerisporangium fuscum TaxID=2835868 RepID=UPI001BDD6E55|nr:nuclear transport factor 2 family protein [Sphaerisporangium fuscum]
MTTETRLNDESRRSLEVLERFYRAEAVYIGAGGPGKADFGVMAECLDPEVVMYQADSLPYGGTWHGPSGIEGFMAGMSEAWESLEFLEQRYVVDGGSVVVWNRGLLRARATGRELETEVMQLMTIKDGRIAEIRPFYLDTAAVLAALRPGGA